MDINDPHGGPEEREAWAALARFFEWLWPDPDAAPADTNLYAGTGHERKHTMKRMISLLGLAALDALSPGSAQAQASQKSATLTVVVSGVHDRQGWLRVHLYARPDGFPADPSKVFAAQDFPLNTLTPNAALDPLTVTFKNLPPGTYALCSIHDSNGNGKLDTNFLGIPREDYAISNNPYPAFRSPHFNEAQFTLGAGESKTVAMHLRH